jgi:hypothetical protein
MAKMEFNISNKNRSVPLLFLAVALLPQCGRIQKNKGVSEFASVSQTAIVKPVGVVMTT